MFVFAHAAHWLEASLLAPPAAVVVVSIARSVRARRAHATKEEVFLHLAIAALGLGAGLASAEPRMAAAPTH